MNNENLTAEKRAKVVYCTCKKILMACTMPDAETDRDIVKDFMKYAKEGLDIDYITLTKAKETGWCENSGKCRKQAKQPQTQASLF